MPYFFVILMLGGVFNSIPLGLLPVASATVSAPNVVYFTSQVINIPPGNYVSAGRLYDFDSDGDLDILDTRYQSPSTPGPIMAIRNNGLGIFSDATAAIFNNQALQSTLPRDFQIADLNGDGRKDFFIADHGSDVSPWPGGQSRILVQTVDGKLVDETASRIPVKNAFTHHVSVGDIDGDGDLDLYMANIFCGCNQGPELYINDGAGHFSANTSRLPSFVTTMQRKFTSSAFLDLNGDGRPELILGGHPGTGSSEASLRDAILMNDGQGNFTSAADTAMPPRAGGTTWGTLHIETSDFDGDGRSDLLLAIVKDGYSDARLQLLLNNGNGTFRDASDRIPQPVLPNVGNRWYVWAFPADFNNDGRIDFVTSSYGLRPYLYLNTGQARFIDKSDLLPAQPLYTAATGDIDGDGDKDIVGINSGGNYFILRNQQPFVIPQRALFDVDGDGKTDLSIFRPGGANGAEWWWLKSSNGGNAALQFGASTDTLVPVDYTGDGKTDVAFWRPGTGQWFVLRSEDFSFYAFPFGATGDVPVPADYDGDGKADAAVFRESAATWYISRSSGGTDIVGFGAAGDKPVNADYDGDGKSDIAIYRPNGPGGAEWWVRRSSNASVFALQFGTSTDKAVPGDFTGDGKADVAFWRPATGFWNVLRSEDFSYYAFPFGANGDIASPGDYDGDGKLDAAVFRPSSATWFANRSTAGTLIQQFGQTGDVPVPSAFVR